MPTQLWKNDFFSTKEQFFNFEEKGQRILKQLNNVAILMTALKLASVIIMSYIFTKQYWPLLIYSIPFSLCVAVHFFILKKKYHLSFILSFYCTPVSIALLGCYEQMTFLIIYQVAYGIVAFFVLQRKRLVIHSYIFSTLTILALGLNEIISAGNTPSYRILFLLINFFTFFIPFYFILGYLRRIIEYNQRSLNDKRKQLSIQNEILEKQNEELIEQELLLEIKHQSLKESAAFQNKIISILSHDIQVPLVSLRNIIKSFTQNKTPYDTIVEYLPDIEENTNYLHALFQDMLNWSKEQKVHEDGKKTYLDLKDIVEKICNAYMSAAKAKKISVINNISNTKIINANEQYVKVIIRNLLSNAIKFTYQGGEISINADKQHNFDIISIKDTGRGISAENLYKIRNGLEIVSSKGTSSEPGTGIGLYFCKEFATKSGGTLLVESVMGEGSVFSFTLPAA